MVAQVVEYYDVNTPQSWKAALLHDCYKGVKVLQAKTLNDTIEELVIYGPDNVVMQFYNDALSSYSGLRPLALIAQNIDEIDYQRWLYNEIHQYDVLNSIQEKEDSDMPYMQETYGLDPLNYEENY